MPSNTKYTVKNEAGEELVTKSKKAQAVSFADEQADANRGQTFTVVTSAGTEVHVAVRRTQGKHAAPWTRTDGSDKIELDVPAGYEIGYVRTRIPALVCRAIDRSGWMIVTPEGSTPAKDTKEAREITNQLGAAAKAARGEALEAAKAEKARLKAEAKAAKEAAAAEVPAKVA